MPSPLPSSTGRPQFRHWSWAGAALVVSAVSASAQTSPKIPADVGVIESAAGTTKRTVPTPRMSTLMKRALERDTSDLKYMREVMTFSVTGVDPMGSILDAEDTLVPRLDDITIEALVVAPNPKERFVLIGNGTADLPRTMREGQRMGNFTITRITRTGLLVDVRRNGRVISTTMPYLNDVTTRRQP